MAWWSVSLQGERFGPYSDNQIGAYAAARRLAEDSPFQMIGGWVHTGFSFKHDKSLVCAVIGVVANPPSLEGREHFFGTIYRTRDNSSSNREED